MRFLAAVGTIHEEKLTSVAIPGVRSKDESAITLFMLALVVYVLCGRCLSVGPCGLIGAVSARLDDRRASERAIAMMSNGQIFTTTTAFSHQDSSILNVLHILARFYQTHRHRV